MTRTWPVRRQRGAIAIMFPAVLLTLLVMCGFAIDLGMAYHRKTTLQSAVDAAALAGASSLKAVSDTPAAIAGAAAAVSAMRNRYDDGSATQFSLPAATLSFAAAPAGAWLTPSQAQLGPVGIRYVRVDYNDSLLAGSEQQAGHLNNNLISLLGDKDDAASAYRQTRVTALAVAGPLGDTEGLHQ